MRPWLVGVLAALAMLVVLASCGGSDSADSAPPLPALDESTLADIVTNSTQPVVLNVWASWCIPCRSEAPLLAAAHAEFGDRVRFVGLDVQDSQSEAADFIAEFGLEFENYFDFDALGRQTLGGIGVPITYFIAPGGSVISTHNGVIDERTLVLGIDELLGR